MYKEALRVLESNDQQQLLAFYEQLDDNQKQSLLDQISKLDFSKISEWIQDYVIKDTPPPVPTDFTPAPCYPLPAASPDQQAKYDKAHKLGEQFLSAGKVAAFVVAGGQGTRLGFDGPKGNFPVSPIKNKTLFQIFAENIAATGKKYGSDLPWYIMTSPLNYSQTVEIFKANNYYGLKESSVFIFQQGTLPNFATDGKILLKDKSEIASSPDGHGGSLKALFDSGACADMQKRGVEYISYFQVDNPLINIFDPLFIGLHASDNAEMSSRALIKAYAMEKVGNFCLIDGKVSVIEYSDLPDEEAERTNPDGSLVFELGSIAIHMISRTFVEHINRDGFALPIHRAHKKIPYINAQGEKVDPAEPNGIKLETFVFDALPLAENSIILQTLREEEFAPVKNATGVDSADVTRQMMTQRAANWLKAAGVNVPENEDGTPNCTLEMAPSFALSPEDVKAKADTIAQIEPGQTLYLC
jgi:UDP-N-acetylglucosamine/UDP-N-acetylgalactosamine diphosphorylase